MFTTPAQNGLVTYTAQPKHGRRRGGQRAVFTGKLACFLEANNHNFDQWMIIVVIYHKKKQKTVNFCPQRSENMKKAGLKVFRHRAGSPAFDYDLEKKTNIKNLTKNLPGPSLKLLLSNPTLATVTMGTHSG